MSIRHLAASASAEDIAAVLAEDGAAIVDALAPASVMDRARGGNCSHTSRQLVLAVMISRDAARAEPRIDRAIRNLPRSGDESARAVGGQKAAGPCRDSFQIHLTQGHHDRARLARAANSSRPVGVRFFQVFQRVSRSSSTRFGR